MTSQTLLQRIFFLFSALFLLLLTITSILIYAFFSNLLVDNTEDYLHQTMRQNQSIVNSSLKQVDEIVVELADDRFLFERIAHPLSDSLVDRSVARQEINRSLIRSVYVPLRQEFSTVNYWFFINDDFPTSALYQEYSFPANRVLAIDQARALPFYEQAAQSGGQVYWFMQPGKPDKIYAACVARSLYNTVSIPNMGMLLLEFNLADLFGDLEQSNLSDHTTYYLVDTAGQIYRVGTQGAVAETRNLAVFLAAHDLLGLDRGGINRTYRTNDQLYSVFSLQSGWLLVGATPFADITGQTQRVLEFLIPWMGVSLMAVILLSYIIARSISRPIATLSRIMRQSAIESNLDLTLPEHKQTVEIAALYAAYIALIERIKLLLHEVFERGIRVKQAEIRTLQAQINPHFLYNTLDAINWTALNLGDSDIPAVLSSLSNILRYSINDSDKLMPLSDELKIVEDYLEIQNFCYSLDIQIAFEGIDPQLPQLFPKLTFQPIIENAILHGFLEHSQKTGVIQFRQIALPGGVRFEIENPANADIQAMNQLLDSGAEPQKHGIRNVHNRLQMLFGPGSGLRFEQTAGGALMVVLTVINPT